MGVVRGVEREAADHFGATRIVQHGLEDLGDLGAVVVPAQPTRVGRIQVDADVGQGKPLDGVHDAVLVRGLRFLAHGQGHVGGQVAERVGFENDDDGLIRVGLELGRDGIDELVHVAGFAILRDLEFPCGRRGRAVAVG